MISRRASFLTISLALAACITLPGCGLVGVVADKVAGDRPVPAVYTPDALAPLVVIAENYRDPNSDGSDAYRVQQLVSERLSENNVAPVISADRVDAVRDRSPSAYRKMSVIDIARAVGAKQVMYVDLASVAVGSQVGGDSLKGVGSANVKLIDVDSGTVLFPRDNDAGAPVAFESELRRRTAEVTPDRVRAETLVGLSGRISRMFHSYLPSDLERLGDGE